MSEVKKEFPTTRGTKTSTVPSQPCCSDGTSPSQRVLAAAPGLMTCSASCVSPNVVISSFFVDGSETATLEASILAHFTRKISQNRGHPYGYDYVYDDDYYY